MLTNDEMLERLKVAAERCGSARQLAHRYNVSNTYLSAVMNGEKPVSARLARAMGFERVIAFRPIPGVTYSVMASLSSPRDESSDSS